MQSQKQTAPAQADAAARTWWPGLQGLRGVAVAAVLVYHHDPRWLPGGFLGVSLFFTLSGFLITTLLVREQDAAGRINLLAFWARRIRRLAPVALLGLLLAAGVALGTASSAALPRIAGDLRAAALNLANWRFAFSEVTYGDTLRTPSPVSHYWSLAIEEQFYIVYPVLALLALRRGRKALAALLAAATVTSLAAQLLLAGSANRVYLGTDTRMAELAIGGLLALGWDALRRRPSERLLDLLGVSAAVALAVAWATVDLGDPVVVRGLLPLHAGLAGIVLLAAVHGRLGPQIAGVRPLVWVGNRSYELYVVHFPLYVLLRPDLVEMRGVRLFGFRMLCAVLLAAVVHRVVGEPFRRGVISTRWQGPPVLAGLAVVLAVAAWLPGIGGSSTDLAAGGLGAETATVVTLPGRGGLAPAAPDPAAPARPVRILVMGDSTAGAVGGGIRLWAQKTGRAEVELVGDGGCALQQEGQAVFRTGWAQPTSRGCKMLIDYTIDTATRSSPDLILLVLGSGQLSDWLLPGQDEPTGIGQPAFDELYVAATDKALRSLATLHIPLLFATTPVPSWRPTSQTADPNIPGTGPIKMNDARRTRRLNELTAAVVARVPLAEVVPYAERIGGADGPVDPAIRPDGLHVTQDLVPGIMEGGLEADLREAYRKVTSRVEVATRNGRHQWSPDPLHP